MKRSILFFIPIFLFLSAPSFAGVFELSGEFGYNRSNYNDGSYTWTKRYSLSLGYYFTADSELEFSFDDSVTRTVVSGVQDVSFHDQVYSLNLNYYFLEETATIRPFIMGGAGQLNRDATGSYVSGGSPPGRTDQLSAVMGAGLKARLSQRLGLKMALKTYLVGAAISTWKDNLALTVGVSFFF